MTPPPFRVVFYLFFFLCFVQRPFFTTSRTCVAAKRAFHSLSPDGSRDLPHPFPSGPPYAPPPPSKGSLRRNKFDPHIASRPFPLIPFFNSRFYFSPPKAPPSLQGPSYGFSENRKSCFLWRDGPHHFFLRWNYSLILPLSSANLFLWKFLDMDRASLHPPSPHFFLITPLYPFPSV